MAGRLQAVMSAAWIVGALGGTALYAVSIGAPLLVARAAMAFAFPRGPDPPMDIRPGPR